MAAATSSLNSSALCNAPLSDNLHLARRDLSGGFAVTLRSRQAALGADQHAPKDRHSTLFRLSVRTAEADQSLLAMLSNGHSAEVRAPMSRRLQFAAKDSILPRSDSLMQFHHSGRCIDCERSCDTPRRAD
jgi:hypothetical protein